MSSENPPVGPSPTTAPVAPQRRSKGPAAVVAIVIVALGRGTGAILGAHHEDQHWQPLYDHAMTEVAHWRSSSEKWQQSRKQIHSKLLSLQHRVAKSVGDLTNPHFVLWNSCVASGPATGCPLTPGREYVGGVPDTFTYYVSFRSTVPVTLKISPPLISSAGRAETARLTGWSGRSQGLFWITEGKRLAACPRCDGELSDVEQRKQEWHSAYATKTEAERDLTTAKANVNDNSHVSRSKQTLAAFLNDDWLPGLASRIRPTTLGTYEIHVRRNIVPTLGHLRLQSVGPSDLNGLYAELLATGLAPKTVRNIHVVIHSALADAMRWGLVQRSAASVADPPRVPRGEMKVWSSDQLRTFLDAARSDRLYAAWLLAATTGMRRGELLGLRRSDVDLQAERLAIRPVPRHGQRPPDVERTKDVCLEARYRIGPGDRRRSAEKPGESGGRAARLGAGIRGLRTDVHPGDRDTPQP